MGESNRIVRTGAQAVALAHNTASIANDYNGGGLAPGSGITSVNGDPGPAVVLTAADVGADVSGAAAAAQAAAIAASVPAAWVPTGGSKYAKLQKRTTTNGDTRWRAADVNNVVDYGADNTGANDSMTAIALAIGDLPSNHGCLYFPPGLYKSTGGAINLTGLTNLLVLGDAAEIFADCPAATISSLTHVTTTATCTMSSAHGWATGNSISVRGAAQADYNGSFTITVTGLTTFTYVMGADPGANATGTLKAQKNIQLMTVAETCNFVTVEGLHFNSNASIRGDGIHLRISSSNSTQTKCTFEGSSGFGSFVGGDGVTSFIVNTVVDTCQFLNTIGDGFHAGGVDGLDIFGCTFDGTGDDSIGIIGYEAFADVNKNVTITSCIIQNMLNAGGGSGCGIRVNMVNGCQISDCSFFNISGPAIRLSDTGSSHTSVYNEEVFIEFIQAKECSVGVEAYFIARARIRSVNTVNCGAVHLAGWKGFNQISDCTAYGEGQASITIYVPPLTSFAGRNFAAHWEDLVITGCGGSSSLSDNLNCLLYMDTDASFDVGKLVIANNTAILYNAGAAWIVYKGIAGSGVGVIVNNTNPGNSTITNAGGTAAGTVVNNN